MIDERALQACREFDELASARGNWETHWREIAERVLPDQRRMFSRGDITQGDKRQEYVVDSTAAIALQRFSSIIDSLLTPQNAIWQRLVPSDPYLTKERSVKLWFEEATRILFKYRYAPKANFAAQNRATFLGLGAFGTGVMFIDPLGSEKGVRYKHIPLGEIYLAQSHQGLVDKGFRFFGLTARQAQQRWPNVPDKIKNAKNPETMFWFLHCVKPRENYNPQKADSKNMPFASLYIAYDEKVILEEGGYRVFPYATSRYHMAPGETYGRSPAMDVLPAIKTLNEQKRTVLEQGHRAVRPVLLAHDDGVLDNFSLKPGAINYGGVNAEGRELIKTLPTGNLAVGKDMMDDERALINDAFLVTLFQILVETPQMTATEVLERTREKGILLAPSLGPLQSEYIGSATERELDLLAVQGLLPPMPPALAEAQGAYSIVYESPLAKTQRAEEAGGLMRTLESALQIVNIVQDPSLLDHFNFDVALPELAEINAVPERWKNGPEEVAKLREARAQQAETQTAIQAAPAAAALIKSTAVAQKEKNKTR